MPQLSELLKGAQAELALIRPRAAMAAWWGDRDNADLTGTSRAEGVAVWLDKADRQLGVSENGVQRDIRAWLARYDALPAAPVQADVDDDSWFPITPALIDVDVEIEPAAGSQP